MSIRRRILKNDEEIDIYLDECSSLESEDVFEDSLDVDSSEHFSVVSSDDSGDEDINKDIENILTAPNALDKAKYYDSLY